MEQTLTKKIQKCYDRELDETRAQLSDLKIRFTGYQEAVFAEIKAKVRQEVNSIDGVMHATAKRFQDLDIPTAAELKGILPVVLLPHQQSSHLLELLRKEKAQKMELKEHENEALQQVLRLQEIMRK